MPWQEQTVEEQTVEEHRVEFVLAARQEAVPVRVLCARTGISRKTGYTWCRQAATAGVEGMAARSRRPHTSPTRTPAAPEAAVVAPRTKHPAWGGRKIHHRLVHQGMAAVPAPSTIAGVLRRHGLLTASPDAPRRGQRFERAAPNDLWQLDFMGHLPLGNGGRVHPLTLVDDQSRFAIHLVACPHERQGPVREHLATAVRRYGLPRAVLTDNGPPWGTSGAGGVTASGSGCGTGGPTIREPQAKSTACTAPSPARSSPIGRRRRPWPSVRSASTRSGRRTTRSAPTPPSRSIAPPAAALRPAPAPSPTR